MTVEDKVRNASNRRKEKFMNAYNKLPGPIRGFLTPATKDHPYESKLMDAGCLCTLQLLGHITPEEKDILREYLFQAIDEFCSEEDKK